MWANTSPLQLMKQEFNMNDIHKIAKVGVVLWLVLVLGAAALVWNDRQVDPAALLESNTYRVTTTEFNEEYRGGVGTGVWLDERTFITNCHVAAQAAPDHTMSITNHTGTEVYKMDVVACDKGMDLALLRPLRPNKSVTRVRFGTPRFFEKILTAGYGFGMNLTPKVGVIGLLMDAGLSTKSRQLTFPVAPGDSGSPVFNEDGELVCVVNAGFLTKTFNGATVPLADRALCIPARAVRVFLLLYQ